MNYFRCLYGNSLAAALSYPHVLTELALEQFQTIYRNLSDEELLFMACATDTLQ